MKETETAFVSKCLHNFSLNVNNIVGYCSDNANVIMENKDSFNHNRYILVNSCICHTAHLIPAAVQKSKKTVSFRRIPTIHAGSAT